MRANTASPKCYCGTGRVAELRYCARNGGVAWQCPACDAMLSNWLPHGTLGDINIRSLPAYVTGSGRPKQPDLFTDDTHAET